MCALWTGGLVEISLFLVLSSMTFHNLLVVLYPEMRLWSWWKSRSAVVPLETTSKPLRNNYSGRLQVLY